MRSDHHCRSASLDSGGAGGELLVKMTSEAVPRSDLLLQALSIISPSPSALMTQEIDPTMKIWPGYGRDEEPIEKTILFNKETTRTPYLALQLSTEYSRQSSEGYPTKVD